MKRTQCGQLKKLPKHIKKLVERDGDRNLDGTSAKPSGILTAQKMMFLRQYGKVP